MPFESVLGPLAVGDSQWINDYGWALLAVIGLLVFSLYIWSYLSKQFELAKAKEGKYLDSDVVEFMERFIKVALIIVIATATLYTAALISDVFRESVWEPFMGYILDIILIILVVMIAMLIVRILRRIARMARIRATGERSLHPSAVEFTSLFTSYIVYLVTTIIVILIFLSLFPDVKPLEAMEDFLAQNGGGLASIIAIVIAIYFVIKLSEAVLEDYKFRTDKFNPKEIDLFKMGIRYSLFIIAFLTAVFGILSLMELEAIGLVLISMVLIFIIMAIALSYSTIQNIVSGLALMDTGPFDVGDRIRVNDEFTCDVIEKGLIFTRVRTLDGELIDVPNNEMIEGRIFNYTLSGKHGISVRFKVSHEVPHSRIEDIANDSVSRVEGISKEPKAELFARDFAGNRIIYELVVYGKDPHKDRRIRSDLIFALQDEFHGHDLTILFK